MRNIVLRPLSIIGGNYYCSATARAWPLSAERKIEVSAEQRLQMYVVNGSDGRCIIAVHLLVGVRYLERPLREVLLYMYVCIYGLQYLVVCSNPLTRTLSYFLVTSNGGHPAVNVLPTLCCYLYAVHFSLLQARLVTEVCTNTFS